MLKRSEMWAMIHKSRNNTLELLWLSQLTSCLIGPTYEWYENNLLLRVLGDLFIFNECHYFLIKQSFQSVCDSYFLLFYSYFIVMNVYIGLTYSMYFKCPVSSILDNACLIFMQATWVCVSSQTYSFLNHPVVTMSRYCRRWGFQKRRPWSYIKLVVFQNFLISALLSGNMVDFKAFLQGGGNWNW